MIHVIRSMVGINSIIGAPVILFIEIQVTVKSLDFMVPNFLWNLGAASHPRINKKGNKVTFPFVEKREYTK